jgi:hypothetical protein
MAVPSPGYSITVRVEAPTDPGATARLSSVVAEAGGAITALDVVESRHDNLVVDVSCNASDVAHSESITKAIAGLEGFAVRKVSDRTFPAPRRQDRGQPEGPAQAPRRPFPRVHARRSPGLPPSQRIRQTRAG